MFDPQANPERRKMVLTTQIIVVALVAGCLFFLLIVLIIVPGKLGTWELRPNQQPMTVFALVVASSLLAMRIVVPRMITAQMLRPLFRQESAAPCWNDVFRVYQTTLIIKAAMIEGAIFLLLTTHMIERSPWSLAVAVIFVAILLLHMPTPQRVDNWIERQSQERRNEFSMR
jgi:hypothetical protein